MPFLDVMHTYFRGEKLEALWFIVPIGVALLVLAGVALRVERGGFAWGIAIPAVLFGLVLLGTGIGVGARTSGQVAALDQQHRTEPAALRTAELARMEVVNASFRTYFITSGVVAALGLILVFAVPTDWARGAGAVLLLVASLVLLIDGFASRRAEPYVAALEALPAPPTDPAPAPAPR